MMRLAFTKRILTPSPAIPLTNASIPKASTKLRVFSSPQPPLSDASMVAAASPPPLTTASIPEASKLRAFSSPPPPLSDASKAATSQRCLCRPSSLSDASKAATSQRCLCRPSSSCEPVTRLPPVKMMRMITRSPRPLAIARRDLAPSPHPWGASIANFMKLRAFSTSAIPPIPEASKLCAFISPQPPLSDTSIAAPSATCPASAILPPLMNTSISGVLKLRAFSSTLPPLLEASAASPTRAIPPLLVNASILEDSSPPLPHSDASTTAFSNPSMSPSRVRRADSSKMWKGSNSPLREHLNRLGCPFIDLRTVQSLNKRYSVNGKMMTEEEAVHFCNKRGEQADNLREAVNDYRNNCDAESFKNLFDMGCPSFSGFERAEVPNLGPDLKEMEVEKIEKTHGASVTFSCVG